MMLRSQGTASRAVTTKTSDKENLNSKPRTRGHDRPRRVLSSLNIDVHKNNTGNKENLRRVETQVKFIEPKPANVPAHIPPTQKTIRAPVQLTIRANKPIHVPVQPIVGAKKPIQVLVQPIVGAKKPTQVSVQQIVGAKQPKQVPVQPIVGAKKSTQVSVQQIVSAKQPTQVAVQPTVCAKKTESFLASLYFEVPAEHCDPIALAFRSDYTKKKGELANFLFNYFNEEVFGGKLPYNITIEWAPKFLKTAGLCQYRYLFNTITQVHVKSARIRLSTKLLDTAYKLQKTLIHVMCHAAEWIIDNPSREEMKDAHGPTCRKWTDLAMKRFPELPPITQYHDYQMKTKFTYKCLACGHCIGRHSKSLDIKTKRCDRCNGQLELLLNRTTRSGRLRSPIPIKDKPLTGFALYVKKNFHKVSKDHGNIKPTEVMKLLGEQFSNLQTGK